MPLEPGLLDREIVMEIAPAAVTDSGFPTFDWNNASRQTLFAQWLPAGTREAYLAQNRLASHVDGVFRIYDMNPRPTPDNTRILFDGRVFDIKPYVEIGRGEGLEIAAVARGE